MMEHLAEACRCLILGILLGAIIVRITVIGPNVVSRDMTTQETFC